jgi:hypothetical protein
MDDLCGMDHAVQIALAVPLDAEDKICFVDFSNNQAHKIQIMQGSYQ